MLARAVLTFMGCTNAENEQTEMHLIRRVKGHGIEFILSGVLG
jgi:hypothetical protein